MRGGPKGESAPPTRGAITSDASANTRCPTSVGTKCSTSSRPTIDEAVGKAPDQPDRTIGRSQQQRPGKSTLNRLELSRETATRYHKIAHDPAAIEKLFVTFFLEAHKTPPKEIILDLDTTDAFSGASHTSRFVGKRSRLSAEASINRGIRRMRRHAFLLD